MERWQKQVAIVTGASGGIGADIAKRLVMSGVIVVGLARRKELIEELAKTLKDAPGKLHAFKVDMRVEKDILDAFAWIRDNLGPVHILINNAGVAKYTSLMEGSTDMWKETVDTNMLGLAIATREAIKDMKKNKVDGHIIHINSIAGHYIPNIPNINIYAATKHAVTAMTETLRRELMENRSKIKISSISPGMVDTDIIKNSGVDLSPNLLKILKEVPSLDCEDVSNAALYILSTPPNVQVRELIISPLWEQ